MVRSNRQLLIIGLVVVVGLIIALWLVVFRDSTNNLKSSDFNSISDSSTGLSFNMSKNFEPIAKDELAVLNSGFNYGFKPVNDSHASCIVSQKKLAASGTIPPPAKLRDGLLKEIRKVHPDAKLDNPKTAAHPVKFGEAAGVLLEVTYKEGINKVKRVEILAVGKTSQVIAYCQSLAADNSKHYNDFTIFFSSLKLTN